MKMILKEDLLTLLYYGERKTYDEVSLNNLLTSFGDDYFIEDGKWVCTNENEYMKVIRERTRRITNGIHEIR